MMSVMLFTRQRLSYKWFRSCYEKVLYKQAITRFPIQNTAQYCISIKDEDRNIFKDYKYKNITNRNNVQGNIKLNYITKEVTNQIGKKNDELTLQNVNLESIQQKVERIYPHPKSSVMNIYALVNQELNQTTLTFDCKKIKKKVSLWQTTLNVKWPEIISFTAINKSKRVASENVALKCLVWLEMNGKLKNGKPIIYSIEEMKEKQLKAVQLSVTPNILNEMKELITTYNTEIQSATTSQKDIANSLSYDKSYNSLTSPIHPILDKVAMNACNIQTRNEILNQRLLERETKNINVTLPIFEFRDEILSKLQNNRVLLIQGDTGCGKTTQVPQFIMDSFTRTGNATDCNIIISQPRRISAISLADRVAHERGEEVGDVVGFHVRLEQTSPSGLGAILFCTTGILLKKLQTNPDLLGCSHVILDEAHERQIDTDMLLILLKQALQLNPNLRVLIMSATLNAHLFQQYFDCPSVKVPGRLYPVQMNFIEDIKRLPKIQKYRTYHYNKPRDHERSQQVLVDIEKIVQVITWITDNKPPGAILCFLPGWHDIMSTQNMLEASLNTNQLILPIHSKMSHSEQRKIFEQSSPNIRKIILATDIAETGITVSDVVYVVDSAIRKEMRWDNDRDLPYISNCWISRANIQQRKGRAGRVKPGESYHLITRAQYENLEAYPLPQILCNPLEQVVLNSKTYTDEKAEKFLSALIQPPSPIAIQKAVNYLMDFGIFDNEENLTALGKRLVLFPTHPKISKALVYSTIFNCTHPIITIASIFSGENNLFYGVLDNKQQIRKNKKLFHPSSDHISLVWIFKQWASYKADYPNLISKFCKDMKLRQGRMDVLNIIRQTFIQHLIQCRIYATPSDHENLDISLNKYEDNDELIRALLYSATQQLIECKNIGFKNGILRKMNYLQTNGRARAMISGESVNYKRKLWPSPFMTYFHSAHCETRRCTVIRESSLMTPLSVLLFNQETVQCRELNDGEVEIEVRVNKRQTSRFSCNKETANVLLEFRDIMWSLVQFSLERQGITKYATDSTTKEVFQYKDRFLDTLTKTLYEVAESIEKDNENEETDKMSI